MVLLAEAITCNLITFYPGSYLTTTNMTTDPSIMPTLPPVGLSTFSNSISQILLIGRCFEPQIDENIEVAEDDIQKEIEEFFRLDPVPIDDLQINSFLQECDLGKTKYFQNQQIQSSSFSVQPKTLDDIIQSDFEKKSIIPDCGLINPISKIDHLPPDLQ